MAERAAGGPPAVAARGLACVRGGLLLFEDLSFEVPAGGALVVAGPNGAGKSSLLRILAGLLRAAAGEARLRARGGGSARPGYLGHRNALKERLTARENLAFWARYAGARGGVGRALERAGLAGAADAPAAWLSAGQRRRLAFARLLAADLDPWLLDEPAANLDAEGETLVRDAIARHRAAGGAVVLASPAGWRLPGAGRVALGAP